MPITDVFDQNAKAYDEWFDQHQSYYRSELVAIQCLLPRSGKGIEIGVGTGRFAQSLGIKTGVEPSPAMQAIARQKGIDVIEGVAENLPLESESFDYALFVATVCFLDSLEAACSETFRILRPGGCAVIGYIEKDSPLGKEYEQNRAESRFYKDARFYTFSQIAHALKSAGFINFSYVQTLFSEDQNMDSIQPVKDGHDDGGFVVIRAMKPDND